MLLLTRLKQENYDLFFMCHRGGVGKIKFYFTFSLNYSIKVQKALLDRRLVEADRDVQKVIEKAMLKAGFQAFFLSFNRCTFH